MSRRARVLLLDDDAQVRRFAAMVLAQLEVDVLECANVAQGVRALEQAPVDVAICDLMLAGESGFDLVELIVAEPAWRGTRVVMFSAAVERADQARMRQLGVWGQLSKPATVGELTAAVTQALADAPPLGPAAAAEVPVSAPGASPRPPTAAEEQEAVARFFEGDATLFEAYRQSCATQFGDDLREADAALAAGDGERLRRLAHSLKTVLGSLGGATLAVHLAEMERLAREGRLHEAGQCWQALRPVLRSMAR
jgi:DNA-binding response OmpR family regulator